MTGAIITQSGQLPYNMVTGSGMTESSKGDFKDVFQDVSELSENKAVDKTEEKVTSATIRVKGDKQNAVKDVTLTKEKKSTEKSDEEVSEALACLNELKSEIMKTLSISEEELENMMDVLGITGAELFTKEGLAALVMEFTGVENVVDLLTNEEAYDMISGLMDFAEGLMAQLDEDFQISEEDLKLLLEQVQEEPVQDEVATETEDQLLQETTENAETVTLNNAQETENVFEQHEGTQNGETESQMHNMSANQVLQNSPTETSSEAVFREMSGMQDVSPQEIYDQISEYMRTNVSGDISEVEMQLNPENLGRLQIHLSSKEGVVSAQFVAQNEVVKGVLETQLIQLKEQFEQQGMKVDAVEVTVAGYSFDQGLNRDTGEHAGNAKEARKMIIRRINLNETAEEELTQDEQIAVEMMAANGNTVDFMA